MILHSLDLLSPEITFFYKGLSHHFNILSGILALMTYSLIFGFSIYFFLEFINKKNPTAYFYNMFVEDAGYYSMDSSSMFHYITFSETPKKIDYKSVNIYGIPTFLNWENAMENLEKIDHWKYGDCKLEQVQEIHSILEDKVAFQNGACIQKMWSVEHQKYFYIGDKNFRYPSIAHGASNPNYTVYGIVVERCIDRKISGEVQECNSEEKIQEFIKTSSPIAINLIDNYIDIGDYYHSLVKYFYKLTAALFEQTFSQNHLNFNPLTIRNHGGIIFEEIDETVSYAFQQNAKATESIKDLTKTRTMICFFFWMQNRVQVYERTYKRLQDALASVGGISKLIFSIALVINRFLHDYKVMTDTEQLYNITLNGLKRNEQQDIKTSLSSANQSDIGLKKVDELRLIPNNGISYLHKKNKKPQKPSIAIKSSVTLWEYLATFPHHFNRYKKTSKVLTFIKLRKRVLSEEILFQYYFLFEKSKSDQLGEEKNDMNNFKLNLEKNRSNYDVVRSIYKDC